jgi:endonuclease YncB( thermonuclease family)
MKSIIIAVALLASAPAIAEPSVVSGRAHVVDADTVIVGETHVRLKGVDAAERGTARGDAATAIMRGIVGNSELTCRLTGEKTGKREVGYCFTSDGRDIGREIVEMGMALACVRYSGRYAGFEQADAVAAQPRSLYCVRRGR